MSAALLVVVVLGQTSGLGVDDCVRVALSGNAQLQEKAAKVEEYRARLAQVEAAFYPKLRGMAYVAPMYTVEGDAAAYERHWQKLADWGPYTHLEATLSQPLYTFGRAAAAETAASQRAAVEEARLREAENVVALEVRKLYYQRLFALSVMPTLEQAGDIVAQAYTRARAKYEEGTGEVSQSDLSRLRYAELEVQRYTLLATDGAALALQALKHTMGMPEASELHLADEKLPAVPDGFATDLVALLTAASSNRPEWAQIEHGKSAASHLDEAERKANLPVLFLAGQLTHDWAPTRDNVANPYLADRYNQLVGGIALGLLFDLDPWKAAARSAEAMAMLRQVEALERFASTGIPLQVRKAQRDVEQAKALVDISTEAVQTARKWMTFSASAYDTGTGEARELLEGVAAFVQARRTYYENLRDFHLARAALDFAVGAR